MKTSVIFCVVFAGCAAEKGFGGAFDSGTDKVASDGNEIDTIGESSSSREPLPDSLKGDSVMHIELDPSCIEDSSSRDVDSSPPEEPLASQSLEISNLESELSSANSAFVAYFDGAQLWVEHRGANASCAEDWRGVTAYFDNDVFYVDYDLQGLGGCVYAVSYALELSVIAPSLVNGRLYRVEAGGDIQYAQYEVASVEYPD